MASKVVVHIGLPKTGTTYLQSILWGSRDALAEQGWLLPGAGHRDHLWAALDLQQRPRLAHRHPDAPGTFERLAEQVDRHPGPALLTHEFFCGARRAQVAALVERFSPTPVHVVVTARHSLAMLTAGWMEYVKNGGVLPLSEMRGERMSGQSEFGWRTWDLAGVLKRWSEHVPPERVHVVPLPVEGRQHTTHWRNFADALGLDPTPFAMPTGTSNPTLGVVQVELLRRVNAELDDFRGPVDRGVWIRGVLAEQHLGKQPAERLTADEAQVADCRERSDRAARMIEDRGFLVHGDAASLVLPSELPTRRRPDEVTDAELVDSAAKLTADLLAELRRCRSET